MSMKNILLDNYSAKKSGESINEHNSNLEAIMHQIINIYKLDNEMIDDLGVVIEYHDIGKVADSMQSVLKGLKVNFIRHEWIGASVSSLNNSQRLAILTHHKQLKKSLELIKNKKYHEELSEVSNKTGVELVDITSFVKKVNRATNREIGDLNTILLKGYLNYCDHLASGNIKEIDTGFKGREKFIFNNYNSIQNKAFITKNDTLIIAMTGLGKTSTSLYWSDNVQNFDSSKRIYYILPYTASINSLYGDFTSRGISTAMLHSKAEYFLKKLDIEFTSNDYKTLKYSTRQINICTIFQLVKAIFSCKRFEMILAQMKNSIFIVDEIHCFDVKTLSYILELLRWLKLNLDVSICIMSASIPICLQQLIKERLDITNIIIPEQNDLIVRHKIIRKNMTIFNDLISIKDDLDSGKQVIICVNNVTTAQLLYKKLSRKYQTKLIHGRLNSRSRENAEKGLKINQLLIGTQAIEVSLDISYDVMYTEVAPWDSMLQRFGRVNRKGEKGICEIQIYNNSEKCIYNSNLIFNTDKIIKEIIEYDESVVYENKVNYYLDKVYPYYNIDEYNIYKEKIEVIIKGLRLGCYNSTGDVIEEMIGDNSISVLPIELIDEYKKFIQNKDYLNAGALLVNISSKHKSKEEVWYNDELEIFLTKYKYDDKLGLVF